jgi:hypothetical protein
MHCAHSFSVQGMCCMGACPPMPPCATHLSRLDAMAQFICTRIEVSTGQSPTLHSAMGLALLCRHS